MAESHAHGETHGNSQAAWVGVGIILLATALICLGLVLGLSVLWIVGILGVLGGTIAWIVLEKAGLGAQTDHDTDATQAIR